jgi:hypothetical protein
MGEKGLKIPTCEKKGSISLEYVQKIKIDEIISINTYTQWVCLGNEYSHTTLVQTCPKDSRLAL